MDSRQKVLVLGDDTRSFLATVRSLARAGLEVHVAPINFRSAALKSRHIAQIHWLPFYLQDGAEWLETITALFRDEGFNLVIPCDERTLIPLRVHQPELAEFTRFAIPDDLALEVFFDKHRTRELARSLGIPIPAGRLISPEDTAPALIAEAGLPMAVKACQSYAPHLLYSRSKVDIVNSEHVLARVLANATDGGHFFEAFFEGQGVGVSILASQGKILQAFEHHRVREVSGSSYYRVSAALSPALLDAVAKMTEAIRYTGIAMFEFRVNRKEGTWVLLEVNARPWGSLPLPVALGVDFPYRWYKLLVEGEETPPHDYPIGIYGRNFIPDIEQMSGTAKRLRYHPVKLIKFCGAALAEFGRPLVGREVSDVLATDDLKPSLYEIRDWIRQVARSVISALPGAASRRRRLDRRRLADAIRYRKRGGVTIMFVCQGNICRSPFAAGLLQRHLANEFHRVRVESSGMLPRMARQSPAAAIEAGNALGVDLESHRSQHLSRTMAENATVIVVFDEINLMRVQDRYPALAAPLVMLGSFASSKHRPITISDPDGGDLVKFQDNYAHIDEAVQGIAAAIRDALNAR